MKDYEREAASRFQNLEDTFRLRDTFSDMKAGLAIMAEDTGKGKLSALFLIILAGSFLPAFLAYLNKWIIDVANRLDLYREQPLLHTSLLLILAITVVGLTVVLLTYLKDLFVAVVFPRMTDNLLEKVMSKSMSVRLHLLDDAEYRNKVSWAAEEMPVKLQNGVMNIALLVQDLFTIVSLAVTIALVDLWVALPVLIGCIPVVIVSYRQNRAMYHYQLASFLDKKKQYYLHTIAYRRAHLRDLRYYGLADYNQDKWEKLTNEINTERKQINYHYSLLRLAANFWMYLMTGIAIGIVAWQSIGSESGLGNMALVFTAISSMQTAIVSCFTRIITIQESSRYIDGYNTLMAFEDEPMGERTLPKNFDIEFRNVTFSYPGTNRPVIKNLNLTIHQGEKIAIVGDNGSGKSTFVSLLSGFYPLDDGEILIGGIPLKDCIGDFRKKSACLYQKSDTFLLTVGENIQIGDMGHAHDQAEIQQAAKLADADGFITKLKDGYDTVIGSLHVVHMFDLSGGQKQKVFLARTALRRSARLLVMDEPTAALDPMAEARLYGEFTELSGDRTVLLISHRLGATKLADRILVFQEGEIVEQGSHDDLIAQNGKYAGMYRAQAKWYKEN